MCNSKYYFKFNKMFNGRMFICQFVTEKVLSWVDFALSITGMLWRNYANCTFVWHILRWIWNNSATVMNRYWFILLHHTRIYKVLMFENVIFLKQQTTLPHHNGSKCIFGGENVEQIYYSRTFSLDPCSYNLYVKTCQKRHAWVMAQISCMSCSRLGPLQITCMPN